MVATEFDPTSLWWLIGFMVGLSLVLLVVFNSGE